MGTKGPSNRYGTSDRAKINFPYSDKFNKNVEEKSGRQSNERHFESHRSSVNAATKEEYEKMAVDFANDIRLGNDSFVNQAGYTYKFNSMSKEFVVVSPDGIVHTYFVPKYKDVNKFWVREKMNKWVKNAKS